MDRLSYFISFIQSYGPSFEEVAIDLKEHIALDQNFKSQLNNGALKRLQHLHYVEPLHSDLITKSGIST